MPPSPSRCSRFNCRERDVFLVPPLVPPVQENLVELLLMVDAARGASAARITVVTSHDAYARSDKKDAPRISIGGRLVADQIVAAGADRVLAMTWHSPPVHGFFSVPVDHLHALHELARHFRGTDLSNAVVMSPDLGNAKEASAFARGSTIIELLDRLRDHDVASIRVACTNGLFTEGAAERIAARDEVPEIVCTNTVPIPGSSRHGKLTVLSVAPALAEAMRRIHNGESVSVLFDASAAAR